MKKSIGIFALVLSANFCLAQAQQPENSIHNYKRQNSAEKYQISESNTLGYTNEQDVASRNYKNQSVIASNSGASMSMEPIEVNVNSVFSVRNYKSSFGAAQPKEVNSNVSMQQIAHANNKKAKNKSYKSQF